MIGIPKIHNVRQGGVPVSVLTRISTLENNEYEITYFEEFSATTGTVTVPTGGTIALNQFAGGVDAYVSTVSSNQPTGVFPQTAGGVAVDVSSFDASGNFTLSGTPSSYPIAIIYVFRITGLYLSNINNDKVINLKDTNFQPLDSDLTAIAGLTPTNDDILQRKSGAWTNRSITQLASDLAIITGSGAYIFMTGGDQSTTSDSATNITDLITPTLEANSRYIISGQIHVGCNNTGGVNFAVDVPTSALLFVNFQGRTSSSTSYRSISVSADATLTGVAVSTFNNNASAVSVLGEITTGANAGTVNFMFASGVSGQTSTIYQRGTFLFIKKIA